jgi:imidazoleglycerol-phosphate dehydratase
VTDATPRRHYKLARCTAETDITLELDLDGQGTHAIDTGLGFLDHMLRTLARFSGFNLSLRCRGDLHIDDHHTVEDTALALGTAIAAALGDRAGIARFGHAYAPLDEALCRVVVDLSGRPFADVHLGFERPTLGAVATENLTHWLESFATAGRMALHVDMLKGRNDHHRAEAAFKALALALRGAVARIGEGVASEKGTLT